MRPGRFPNDIGIVSAVWNGSENITVTFSAPYTDPGDESAWTVASGGGEVNPDEVDPGNAYSIDLINFGEYDGPTEVTIANGTNGPMFAGGFQLPDGTTFPVSTMMAAAIAKPSVAATIQKFHGPAKRPARKPPSEKSD